jgi:hypothetical protein
MPTFLKLKYLLPVMSGVVGFIVSKIQPVADLADPPAAASQGLKKAEVVMRPTWPVETSAGLTALGKARAGDFPYLFKSALERHSPTDRILLPVLIAGWAERDGPGLIAHLKSLPPSPEREKWLVQAWKAWGAANATAALDAGGDLPKGQSLALIAGVAEKDVQKAVDFALKQKDAQFMLAGISDKMAQQPGLIEKTLPRAMYDGMRQPLQKAQIQALIKKDPKLALEAARKTGVIGHDPVPIALQEIAKQDLSAARELCEEMPSSRTKALSSVALVSSWAGQDAAAALAWTREKLTGPVKQAALCQMAADMGGQNPEAGLQLLEEAGWAINGDFYAIRGGTMLMSETRQRPNPQALAKDLLERLRATDPAKANVWEEKSKNSTPTKQP